MNVSKSSKDNAVTLRDFVNGKFVYWLLTIVIALCGILFGDIRGDLREIKSEVNGIDVIKSRIARLEQHHPAKVP